MNNYIEEYWLTSHTISGTIHFVSATIGLFLGLGILFLKPGSKIHKTAGYIFIPVLLIVNISALFIHEMGMQFGPFHFLIPFSLYFLYLGIKPFIFDIKGKERLKLHIKGMVAAAIGLWAAFVAESLVRTPAIGEYLLTLGNNPFWILTIEGFSIAFLFTFIIKKVYTYQYKKLGLK